MHNRITASCLIRNHQVWRSGELVYEHPGATEALPEFLNGCYRWLGRNYGKFFKMDTLSKVGWLAAELVADATGQSGRDVGIVLQNRSSSYDVDYQHQATIQDLAAFYPSPALFVYTLPNIVMGEIAIRHDFRGENALFVRAAFDPTFQVQYVDYLFNKKLINAGIGGWVEAGPTGYEAFLYAVEPSSNADLPIHTAPVLAELYQAQPTPAFDYAF